MDTNTIDILNLIERDTRLKKVANTGGGEYHGPCPKCGGVDRFSVQPNHPGGGRFWCRQCGFSGDAIAYVMERDNLKFPDACGLLGLNVSKIPATGRKRGDLARVPAASIPVVGTVPDDYIAMNDPRWRDAAEDFAGVCFDRLHSEEGSRARAYLMERGISEPVMTAYGLGLNLEWVQMRWGETDVKIGKGIIIPWHDRGQYVGIRIRPPKGGYYWAKGSAAKWLYGAITPGCTVVLVEAELDALTIRSQAKMLRGQGGRLVAVATGGSTGSHALRWVARLNWASRVMIAFDADDPGDKAAAWWLERLGGKAQRLRPVGGKDPGEMFQAGVSIPDWIIGGGVGWTSINANNSNLFA